MNEGLVVYITTEERRGSPRGAPHTPQHSPRSAHPTSLSGASYRLRGDPSPYLQLTQNREAGSRVWESTDCVTPPKVSLCPTFSGWGSACVAVPSGHPQGTGSA